MIKYSTEYLLMHEDEVDWNKISADKDDYLTLIEVKLFRRNINWEIYLINHKNIISTNMLEFACKYFNENTYNAIASFDIASEEFIVKHHDKFNFETVIKNCKLTEDAIFACKDDWINLPNIKEKFYEAKQIDITRPEYSRLRLFLETL